MDESVPTSPSRWRIALILIVLILLGCVVAQVLPQSAIHEAIWPDECIYLVGARNVIERRSLATNYYLSHSLLIRGYPHRDVHMPGYILALAPFVKWWGMEYRTGVRLNLILYLASIPLVFFIAYRLMRSLWVAGTAAALFLVLPPFPAYLSVVFPEHLVSFVFLAGLTLVLWRAFRGQAIVAGVVLGLGILFRESLIFGLPIFWAALPARERLRKFLPAVLVALAGLTPLSSQRAIHANALFPSVLSEAARSERPISTFLIAIQNNILLNIRLLTEADPRTSIEDQALLFFAILALAGALVMPRLAANERTIARAIYYSSGLIVMAMFAAYVVRAKGGVWGGVRALMPWSVLWLILTAVGLVKLVQRKWALVIVVAVLVFGFVVMDRLQVYHFYRLKYADREDQARCESYMERYLGRGQPRRILARNFLFGLHNYPVETIWSLPRDYEEMRALEQAIGFDYVILQERSPIRLHFVQNPRYIRINKEDKGAEFLIWRRLY